MLLVLAVVAGVFLSMGLGVTTSTTPDGECKNPQTVLPLGRKSLIVKGSTDNCTCTLREGKPGRHADGTPCTGVKNGKRIRGNCTKGECEPAESTYGCEGRNGTEKDSIVNPVLCFFECYNGERKEWRYLPDGTPCVNKDDGTDENGKNGTCKHRPHRDAPNETVCFPNDQLHLVGC
uniref:Putative secreted protein n=1 Tax=Amblyomma cajennense TaxID=34607 RepID=A0A023FTR0_AMBCJ